MMRLSLCACIAGFVVAPLAAQRSDTWALHGHDLGGHRFSPLTVGGNALFGLTQGDMVIAFGLAR
jgi:hypothetical protein